MQDNDVAKKNSQFLEIMKRLAKNRLAVAGLIVIILLIILAFLAPVISPYPYEEAHLTDKLQKPSATYLFGTDELGRDIFSRLLYGSRYSLRIGLIAVMISALGGIFLGSLAGYFGGNADLIIMRLLDVLQAMPGIVLAIAISARTDQFRNRSFHQFYSRFCEDDQSVHIECAADGISGSGDVH